MKTYRLVQVKSVLNHTTTKNSLALIQSSTNFFEYRFKFQIEKSWWFLFVYLPALLIMTLHTAAIYFSLLLMRFKLYLSVTHQKRLFYHDLFGKEIIDSHSKKWIS